MSIYDIDGNLLMADNIEAQGRMTVKRNNYSLVTEFLTVAQTYLNQSSIVYSDGNTIFDTSSASNGIDCSTYVGLVMMGYPFNKSPYATGNYISPDAWVENSTDYSWAIPTLNYKVSRYADGHNPDERLRLACQFARWMYDRNQVVPLTNGFRDVLPGDIVFWGHKNSTTGDWPNDWFMHIGHIGIVLTKENAPITFIDVNGNTQNWDKTKYPFKHTIIDVRGGTPPCSTNHWLEEGQEDATKIYVNNVNTIQLICRPDLGALAE